MRVAPSVPVMTGDGHGIVNPLSGERIRILTPGEDTGGRLLAWELLLAPGGRVPAGHRHPLQEERFTLLAGRLRFRLGRRRLTLGPGQSVVVPPGSVHAFANAGPEPVRVLVHTRPALRMQALLETAAALARDQQATGQRLPRLRELVLFMDEFDREVAAPYLPRLLLRPLLATASRLARRRGKDARYRRLRATDAPERSGPDSTGRAPHGSSRIPARGGTARRAGLRP